MLSTAPISEPAGSPPLLHQEVSASSQLSQIPVQTSSSSAPSLLPAGRLAPVQTGSSPTSPLTSPYSDAQQSAHPPSGMSASPIVSSSHEAAEVPLSSLPAATPAAGISGDFSTASEPGPLLETMQLEGSSGLADPLTSTSQDIMFTCQSEPPTISMPERLGRQESRLDKVHRMRVIISISGIPVPGPLLLGIPS